METNSVVFFNAQSYQELPNKPIIAAWQIINPENIGNLIRLADNVGAEDVYILGEDFHLRMSSIRKTALARPAIPPPTISALRSSIPSGLCALTLSNCFI